MKAKIAAKTQENINYYKKIYFCKVCTWLGFWQNKFPLIFNINFWQNLLV